MLPDQNRTAQNILQEKFQDSWYDLEIPSIVQWEMLWFSAPTILNNDLLNDGEILDTPRIRFLKAMRKVLEDMPE